MHAILLTALALAEEPAAPVDPHAAPVTTPLTPAGPGPFTCSVDPYVAVTAGSSTSVRVRLTVPAGTKVYRDMVAVVVTEAGGLQVGEVVLPPGKPFEDPFGGGQREVYDADTEFFVPITVPAKTRRGRVDLTFDVSWQGCAEGKCYMPSGQTFNVPIRVGAAPS